MDLTKCDGVRISKFAYVRPMKIGILWQGEAMFGRITAVAEGLGGVLSARGVGPIAVKLFTKKHL